jgi:hypothetical protein
MSVIFRPGNKPDALRKWSVIECLAGWLRPLVGFVPNLWETSLAGIGW